MAIDTVSLCKRQFFFRGKPLHLHGIGLGSWLNLEHFMVGLPGLDGSIRRAMEQCCPGVMEQFTRSFFTDEDAKYLKSIGVNFLRVPVNHHLFWDDERNRPREAGLAVLRELAQICDRHQLFFMPDLHTAPGGQNPDWHCENPTGVPLFWEFKALRDSAVRIWQWIAQAVKDSDYLLGYDLLNEPVLNGKDVDLLNTFYAEAIAAISEVDNRHLFLLEGERFAMDFRGIALPDPRRCCFTYHFYPGVWDSALNQPDLPPEKRKAGFRLAHQKIMDTMGDYEGPLLCGEAGVELQTLGDGAGVEQLRETLEVLDENQSSWCLWSYKDTGMMGLQVPKDQTPWQQLASRIRRQWSHHLDMDRGSALASGISQAYALQLTEKELYEMQFRLRAMLFEPEVTHLLIPALKEMSPLSPEQLGQSFALEHCVERTAYRKLLQAACKHDET